MKQKPSIIKNVNEKNATGLLSFFLGKNITENKKFLFVLPFVIELIQTFLSKSGTRRK